MNTSQSARRLLLLAAAAVAAALAVWAWRVLATPTAMTIAAVKDLAVHAVPAAVEVRADFVTELKSEIAGRISESRLETGRPVAEGEILARLDSGDVDLEIERLGHEIAAARKRLEAGSGARAELENTRESVAQLERQVKAGQVAQSTYAQAARSLQQLGQRVELEEANLQLALQNLETSLRAKLREREKMTIRAPAAGVINTVLARKGDLITGNAPIAVLISDARIVEAKVSEEHMAAIRVGQRSSVRFLSYGLTQFDAEVAKILPSADPATQRYTVHLAVKMPAGQPLVPGLTGEASILVDSRPNAVVIPRRAVVGGHVLVVDGGRIVRRQVAVGYESLNNVEILEGIAPGDHVVVEDQDQFREGDRVRSRVFE